MTVSSPLQQDSGIPSTLEKAEESFPEGGLRAWLVVFGAWCGLQVQLAALGITNTIAALQAYVSTHQLTGIGEDRIGWIFSLYTFLSFFCGVYIGPLFDKHGPRLLVFIGSLCIIGGLMLLSICHEYWHFLVVFGIINGIGCSLLFTPCLAAVGHFFQARRGLATGIASSGGSIGGIIFPFMLQSLIPNPSLGWPWALRILGFSCLVLVSIANLLVRSRLPGSQNASIHPDISIFKNKVFFWTTVAVFFMEMALFIPLGYISSYALAQGFSEDFSFQVLMIMNAGSFFGRALPGWWADRIGPFNANMLSIILSVVVCFAVWLPFGHTLPGLVVFAVTIGFASGNNISITPVCIGKLCETQQYGRYYATCFTVVSLACLLGIPLGGNLITACEGSYWGLIVFTGCMFTVSLCTFAIARGLGAGWSINTVF
ncbi:major facilitator superfamily transporter [Truncatella angustata]|uniref:Major facilitator superfamily transporter n=1 Tax=Truncatella angustata TaxID=152316 RepID=A0A9P8ZVU6_9PEZI|nr:major facilitator superfamily transporter [Truncatella angustata]KAH6652365.1 major facilitator superfamily transporter [Truncatella angustata]